MPKIVRVVVDVIISIVIILAAMGCLIYFWKIIDTSTKATTSLGIITIIAVVYYSSFKPLFLKDKEINKEIRQTDKEYEKKIRPIQDTKKVEYELSKKAQELSIYLRNELITSNIETESRENIKEAIELYEEGKFANCIFQIGRSLEGCVGNVIDSLNKKHIIKLSESKQKRISLAEKINFLFSKKKISYTDLSKLHIIRKYRNITAHRSKDEIIDASKNAKLVIELGIELIEKIQKLCK